MSRHPFEVEVCGHKCICCAATDRIAMVKTMTREQLTAVLSLDPHDLQMTVRTRAIARLRRLEQEES